MTVYYPAVIETDAQGGYGVFFPDLPGCVSAGDTQDEAADNAVEALLMHLEAMLEDGVDLPPPSRLEDIAHDPDVTEVGRILAPAGPFRLERVNVSFDGMLLARIDRAASARGQSRSEFLAAGAKRLLGERESSSVVRPKLRTRRKSA